MSKLIRNVIIVLAIVLTSGLVYTHTESFVTKTYEKAINQGCNMDIMCLFGAALLENNVVNCMQHKLISWSDNTIEQCINQVANKLEK